MTSQNPARDGSETMTTDKDRLDRAVRRWARAYFGSNRPIYGLRIVASHNSLSPFCLEWIRKEYARG